MSLENRMPLSLQVAALVVSLTAVCATSRAAQELAPPTNTAGSVVALTSDPFELIQWPESRLGRFREDGTWKFDGTGVIAPRSCITGRVLDAVDGAPIDGAWIEVFGRSGLVDPDPVRTRSDGSFEAYGPPSGDVVVRASREGWQPVERRITRGGGSGNVCDLDLRLAPALRLRARVRWPDGTPAAGAHLACAPILASVELIDGVLRSVRSTRAPAWGLTNWEVPWNPVCVLPDAAATDAGGEFVFACTTTDDRCVRAEARRALPVDVLRALDAETRARFEGRDVRWMVERDLRAIEDAPLVLQPLPAIVGRVTRPTTNDDARVRVHAERLRGLDSSDVGDIESVVRDLLLEGGVGEFLLDGLAPGRWRLDVVSEDDSLARVQRELEVDAWHTIDVALVERPRVQGTVRTKDGEPARHVFVTLEWLRVDEPDNPDWVWPPAWCERELALRLAMRRTLAPRGWFTDDAGCFAFEHVQLGRVRLVADAGLGAEALRVFEVDGRRASLRADLALAAECVLTGRVLAPDGRPLAGVRVEAARVEDPLRFRCHVSDEAGAFRFEGLPAGQWTVGVRRIPHDATFVGPLPIDAPSGLAAEASLELSPSASGTVELRFGP